MRKFTAVLFFVLSFGVLFLSAQTHRFETVPDDPMQVKMCTLSNGMMVYMSVYKDVPRIQTYVAVHVGSKNDPAETTGLAHYLEHLMFKGTSRIGTLDWEREKPLLDEIERQFELYRATTDQGDRAAIYHVIDSLSYQASGYAVPNEYVKLMRMIGSSGTNAWTSNDNTVYIENIPSNQLETWARIQGERFSDPVIRLFHTELETVYEEKNRSLTSDSRKASEVMLSALYPAHPYGLQTTLGHAEHLKNPSITNIKNFIHTYYVPNNMAVILAGDFDPDEAVDILEKHFGGLQPRALPAQVQVAAEEQQPLHNGVIRREVVGQEAEFVNIAFRIGRPANTTDIYMLRMLDYVMNNGKCGLIDLNVNKKQLAASASAYPYVLCDNSSFVLSGKPKEGQTLEEVEQILLEQLELVRTGQFDDGLMTASLNNIRLQEMRQLESASSRASKMLNAFNNEIPWSQVCQEMSIYQNITKANLVDFVNRYFKQDYVVVYKRKGVPEETTPVVKPPITPIQINRDEESAFAKQMSETKVPSIEPVFVDFKKDMQKKEMGEAQILHVKNVENETFSVTLIYPVGEMYDNRLPVAAAYLNYLGTSDYTADEISRKLYELGCSFSIRCEDYQTRVAVSGLSENFIPAVDLVMQLLNKAVPDEAALKSMVSTQIKNMRDAKSSQDKVLDALRVYVEYGPRLVEYSLKPSQLEGLSADELVDLLHNIPCQAPIISYYGPLSMGKVVAAMKKTGVLRQRWACPLPHIVFNRAETMENQVFFVPYNAKQARQVTYSCAPVFDPSLMPIVRLYNSYFGGGMNAIVFQELREKRSLAYTAKSSFILPARADENMYNYSFIGTQNDKVIDAWAAFDELFNDMPVSESAFELAKENALSNIATSRYTKGRILSCYLENKDLGFDYDRRIDIYGKMQQLTLEDVKAFNRKFVAGQPKSYMILVREKDVDLKQLEQFGPVHPLTLEEIFGF
ncbi:MAG: insulinase family protein [Bacteroidales bacterium]|nr:insulinase family protein [Bacteroidales bacterium]